MPMTTFWLFLLYSTGPQPTTPPVASAVRRVRAAFEPEPPDLETIR
ncbi:hypothetical protein [Streptosporangium sp. KLBMP 9127]|nr:hypothetical protein [Streptosporangium sp. KLBMP 9127]